MKIVYIIGSLHGGGAERVTSELASEMSKMKHDITIILVASSVISYSLPKEVNIIDCSKKFKVKGISFFKRIGLIRKKIVEIRPDVCISFTVAVNIYSILSCINLECILVLAERNDPRYDPSSIILRLLRFVLYRFADKFVFQTDTVKSYFSKRIQNRSKVIPNPINSNMPSIYLGERSKKIVTAARLTPQKNIKMAIDAFRIVYEVHNDYIFEIYGDGPLKNELVAYVNRLGLKDVVVFKGLLKELHYRIYDAAVFILSSDYEGMSNSMLESLAMGIPTISTDYPSGGAREIIKDGENGMIVPVNNYREMSKAIIKIIEDKEFALLIGNNGEKIKYWLSTNIIAQEWISFIRSNDSCGLI